MDASVSENKYYFCGFGLHIVSDIYFPELFASEEKVEEVNITYGKVPAKIEDIIWSYAGAELSKNELLLHIENVACYYVANGRSIVIQPEEYADEASVKQYILGTCIGTVMLQRGILPIHGSCTIINDVCIIFTGSSGVGKSTLTAALSNAGYLFVSDDISVISQDHEGKPLVQPGLLQQKLTPESANALGVNIQPLKFADMDKDKYLLPKCSGYQKTSVKLSIICELLPEDRTDVTLTPLEGVEKFNTIIRNIYRHEILVNIGTSPEFLKNCLSAAKNIRMYRLKRPKGTFTIEEQIKVIEELISCFNK